MHSFNEITLLVTHYNRSSSFEKQLHTLKDLNCQFNDIVVSDDCSQPEHLDKLRELQKQWQFTLIETPRNGGLGHNINKGQDAVKTPFTFYMQEDFVPQHGFVEKLQIALDYLKKDQSLDIVRFHAYRKYPYLKPYGNGFSFMRFSLALPGYKKFYAYSDHPHLRRSGFFERFGRYTEGGHGDRMEYRMMMSFLQNKGKGLFHDEYQTLVKHDNSEEESTIPRSAWMQLRRGNNWISKILSSIYRNTRFTLDYLFLNAKN